MFFIFAFILSLFLLFIQSRVDQYSGGKDRIKDLKTSPRSRTEAAVIRVAESIIGQSMPTVNPDWLIYNGKTLELDGYCKDKNIALEFSGPLHTKWYPTREPYEHYFERLIKDKVKEQQCAKHDTLLIVIDMRLPGRHWRNYIQSRLYDWKPTEWPKPANYIAKQEVKPFRNEQLEEELKLDASLLNDDIHK